MLFMSEVSPQISVVTFARTKIIVARAIFDECARSNFLHGLPVDYKSAAPIYTRGMGKGYHVHWTTLNITPGTRPRARVNYMYTIARVFTVP